MKNQRGFTLVEVMVAIAISSMVALLSYSVARPGFDTESSVDERNASSAAEVQIRSYLFQALRHPAASGGALMNDTLFAIRDNGFDFAANDRRVFVEVIDTTLTLKVDRVVFRLPGVSGIEVRVLDRTRDAEWSRSWIALGRLPAAVRVDFQASRPIAPIIVHTALEQVR